MFELLFYVSNPSRLDFIFLPLKILSVFRAVVLESGLGRFSIISDLSWTCWYLDSDLSRTWSLDSPNVQDSLDRVQQYMLFFLFQNKTINLARLFRKRVT